MGLCGAALADETTVGWTVAVGGGAEVTAVTAAFAGPAVPPDGEAGLISGPAG